MRQVFCNLLDNAAKHGGSGKRIDTAIRREGDAAVITIRDYGPGIPEDELPHVKYKFYKGSSKARGPGSALRCARRSSPGTMVAWTLATLRAAGASSPSACRSAAGGRPEVRTKVRIFNAFDMSLIHNAT